MNQETTKDSLDEMVDSKLPSALNVLTILTIIGCILALCGEVWGYVSAEKSYKDTKEMIESGKINDAPKFVRNMVNEKTLAIQKKRMENKMPMLLLGLVSAALCFYGALQMRKRKKQGYTLWLAGEVLPIVTTIIFLGGGAFSGFGLLILVFPLIFIILYTVNRKHLLY